MDKGDYEKHQRTTADEILVFNGMIFKEYQIDSKDFIINYF